MSDLFHVPPESEYFVLFNVTLFSQVMEIDLVGVNWCNSPSFCCGLHLKPVHSKIQCVNS